MNYRKLVFALLLITCSNIAGQVISVEEVKGIDSTYIMEEYKNAFGVRNKSATFKNTMPYFIEYAELGGKLPEIAINNKAEMDVYVRIYFAPYFAEVKREFNNSELLIIELFSNHNGVIRDFEIVYPKDIQLPISAFEQFHKAILSSNLRLVFDKTHKAFAISPWIGRSFRYNSNTIKEMANNH